MPWTIKLRTLVCSILSNAHSAVEAYCFTVYTHTVRCIDRPGNVHHRRNFVYTRKWRRVYTGGSRLPRYVCLQHSRSIKCVFIAAVVVMGEIPSTQTAILLTVLYAVHLSDVIVVFLCVRCHMTSTSSIILVIAYLTAILLWGNYLRTAIDNHCVQVAS